MIGYVVLVVAVAYIPKLEKVAHCQTKTTLEKKCVKILLHSDEKGQIATFGHLNNVEDYGILIEQLNIIFGCIISIYNMCINIR